MASLVVGRQILKEGCVLSLVGSGWMASILDFGGFLTSVGSGSTQGSGRIHGPPRLGGDAAGHLHQVTGR